MPDLKELDGAENKRKGGKVLFTAVAIVGVLVVGFVWLNHQRTTFPNPPDEATAREQCISAVSGFFDSVPTPAMVKGKIFKEDLEEAKKIWMDETVSNDAFVQRILDAYAVRHKEDIENADQSDNTSLYTFSRFLVGVKLPPNNVNAGMICEFRSYGEVWKLFRLRLTREGAKNFAFFPVSEPEDFPGHK